MNEVDAVMEQLDAAHDIIHHYKCFYCQIATAQHPVILVAPDPIDGSRIIVIGVCDTCGTKE